MTIQTSDREAYLAKVDALLAKIEDATPDEYLHLREMLDMLCSSD